MRSISAGEIVARCIGVVALGLGTGYLVGAFVFSAVGKEGFLTNSPFGHICEVYGAGSGLLVTSLSIFSQIRAVKTPMPLASKPEVPEELREHV